MEECEALDETDYFDVLDVIDGDFKNYYSRLVVVLFLLFYTSLNFKFIILFFYLLLGNSRFVVELFYLKRFALKII